MADVTVDPEVADPGELVKIGIKAFMLRDYNAAVTAFSRSIELTVAEHGDKHDSLGNIYLHYGKTLLEISREETEALGDAVTRDLNNSDSDDEEASAEPTSEGTKKTEEKSDQSTEEKDEENKTNGSEKTNADATEAGDTKPSQGTKDKVLSDVQNGEIKVAESSSDDKPSGSGTSSDAKSPEEGETTEEKTEDEPTDLQLAWEVLELAKLIFEKRADAGKKELAETLIVLGEVSLESENFESAITDIKQGLEIQKGIFKPDSRILAETHYKLAIALSTNNQIDEAIENFNTSLVTLNNKLLKLKENEEQEKDEIKDIESLIPEIEEKIADMKSYKEETANKLVSAITSRQTTDGKFEAGSSSKQVSDISHLVKRKRKLEDVVEDCEENPAKKQPNP